MYGQIFIDTMIVLLYYQLTLTVVEHRGLSQRNALLFVLRSMRMIAGFRSACLAVTTIGCISLSGCDPVSSSQPQALPMVTSSSIVSEQTETLSPAETRQVMGTSVEAAYTLGANDVISVTVYNHPELTVPAEYSSTGGALITSDGTVQLPLVGNVYLGGKTLAQARAAITAAYRAYIKDPQVAVQLVQAQSLRYYLLGDFTTPGVKYPAHQLTLLEALALGGSVNISQADLSQAYVAQNKVKLPVDLYALLVEGDLTQNVPLAPGDTIVVPPSTNENAFVFGSVGKPGAIPFLSGRLSLLQALSVAGLDLPSYTQARLSQVHIIRAHGTSAEFIVVDAHKILNGQAAPFTLVPGDIVFVPPTGIATWNQVLAQLIPSLEAIGDILNPFVQIKFLSQSNNSNGIF
jgi:polysaccharide export outer membrane protein